MSNKEIILKVESDLEELENIIKTKKSLLIQAFQNRENQPLLTSLLNKIKEITNTQEYKILQQEITDFNSLKKYLGTFISPNDITLIKKLEQSLSEFKQFFENELREEKLHNFENVDLEKKMSEFEFELNNISNNKEDLFNLMKKYSSSNYWQENKFDEYLKQFNLNYLKNKSFVNETFLTQLYQLGINSGKSPNMLFDTGIPAIIPFIEKFPLLWPQLYELGINSGVGSYSLFSYGIPTMLPFIEKYPNLWPQLYAIGMKSGRSSGMLFEYGIPSIMEFFEKSPELWTKLGLTLINIAIKCDGNSELIFGNGIPAVMPFIEQDPNLLEKFGEILINLAIKSDKYPFELFVYGIPVIMPYIKNNFNLLEKIGLKLINLGIKSGLNQNILFGTGIPYLVYFFKNNLFSVEVGFNFLEDVLKKYPKNFMEILDILKLVGPEITSSDDLGIFWSYVKDFKLLDLNTFREYKSLTSEQRKEYIKNIITRFQKIVHGEKIEYTKNDLPYIYYAINSKNLTFDEMNSTLKTYGGQVKDLPKVNFDSFDFKIREVIDLKIDGTLNEKLFNYYKEFFSLIITTKDIPQINYLDYFKNSKRLSNPILGSDYSNDIAWRIIIYNIYHKLGEDTKNKLNLITKLDFNNINKIELSETYFAIEELYNDTVKDNPLNLNEDVLNLFLQNHQSLSRINTLLKEVKKFKEVQGKGSKIIKCMPSKESIDLFYGYYGENCTSSAPAELLNSNFLPIRLIVDNKIQGCLHFYFSDFQNKKMLSILGIEPRSWLCNNINNKKFFSECINSCIYFAKKYNFDLVTIPVNSTMHSNRGQISSLMAEEIRNKKQINLKPDIEFPKNHNGYKTNGLRIIWKKGFF